MVVIKTTLNSEVRISPKEWRWVLIYSAVILLLTSLPYLYGAALSTPTNQFGGFIIGIEDGNSYLAKMRLGATNGWQFHLFYTSEPHPGAYLFLFHLLLGKIARLSGLSFILVYHLARVMCGFLLLVTIYYFTAFFTDLAPVRRLTFWLVALGSGLGWLVVWLGLSERLGLPLDFYSPEAFSFHCLFGLPHLSLAETLLLWSLLLLWRAWERQYWGYALLAGLALLGVAIIGAFYLVIAGAVIGAGLLLRVWRERRMPEGGGRGFWSEIGLASLTLVIPAPVLFYNIYVFTTHPIFKIWAKQNLILSPSPLHYVLGFGLLLLPAFSGGWQEWRRDSKRSLLLIGWCVVVPLLVYLPFNLQRRMTLGAQIPLSILAALGLWQGWNSHKIPSGSSSRQWWIIATGMVLLLSLSNIFILVGAGLEVSRSALPLFHPKAQVDAADWLGENVSLDDVVLAAYETGNYLPTQMSARVFAGHGSETVYADEKRAMLPQFFAPDNDNFRRQLLQDYHVTYLFYGPAEQALGSFSPAEAPYLRQIYNSGTVQIYRVTEEIAPKGVK